MVKKFKKKKGNKRIAPSHLGSTPCPGLGTAAPTGSRERGGKTQKHIPTHLIKVCSYLYNLACSRDCYRKPKAARARRRRTGRRACSTGWCCSRWLSGRRWWASRCRSLGKSRGGPEGGHHHHRPHREPQGVRVAGGSHLARQGWLSTPTQGPGWQTAPGRPPGRKWGSQRAPASSNRGWGTHLLGGEITARSAPAWVAIPATPSPGRNGGAGFCISSICSRQQCCIRTAPTHAFISYVYRQAYLLFIYSILRCSKWRVLASSSSEEPAWPL